MGITWNTSFLQHDAFTGEAKQSLWTVEFNLDHQGAGLADKELRDWIQRTLSSNFFAFQTLSFKVWVLSVL